MTHPTTPTDIGFSPDAPEADTSRPWTDLTVERLDGRTSATGATDPRTRLGGHPDSVLLGEHGLLERMISRAEQAERDRDSWQRAAHTAGAYREEERTRAEAAEAARDAAQEEAVRRVTREVAKKQALCHHVFEDREWEGGIAMLGPVEVITGGNFLECPKCGLACDMQEGIDYADARDAALGREARLREALERIRAHAESDDEMAKADGILGPDETGFYHGVSRSALADTAGGDLV